MPYDPRVPLLEHLSNELPGLRRSERQVATIVADNPSFVVSSTMARVAEAAGVSEPTVMRFCTNLGFEGFNQFRMALAQALALGLPATLSTISANDSIGELSTKVFDHTISSLDRTRRYLDADRVEAAVRAILDADSIILAGLGASAITAMDAAQKAPLFGIPCSMPSDLHQQFMAATMADSRTVVVVISNTGATRSMVRIANAGKDAGATVVGITGEEESPLATVCDVAIILKTFEDTDVLTPTVSRLAALVVIDILATAVSLGRGADHAKRLARMKEQLTTFRRSERD
jgi:RpiR family carbohydrate utilization transcriptional regulator